MLTLVSHLLTPVSVSKRTLISGGLYITPPSSGYLASGVGAPICESTVVASGIKTSVTNGSPTCEAVVTAHANRYNSGIGVMVAELVATGDNIREGGRASILDLSARITDIQFSFDGSTPPTPGDNIRTFGICHTAGGSFIEGAVYFDSGDALVNYSSLSKMITTRLPVFGNLDLVENAVYVNESGTWIQKIDHSFVAKEVKVDNLVNIDGDEQRIVHESFPIKAGGKLKVAAGGQIVII